MHHVFGVILLIFGLLGGCALLDEGTTYPTGLEGGNEGHGELNDAAAPAGGDGR